MIVDPDGMVMGQTTPLRPSHARPKYPVSSIKVIYYYCHWVYISNKHTQSLHFDYSFRVQLIDGEMDGIIPPGKSSINGISSVPVIQFSSRGLDDAHRQHATAFICGRARYAGM